MIIEILGWIGSALVTLCVVPQTIKVIKEKSAAGLSWAYLTMWLGGVLCLVLYMADKEAWAAFPSYTASIVGSSTMIWYKWKESFQ